MKPITTACAVLLALALALPAAASADMTGLWEADFMGNRVECHLEQRGNFLYGVAYVFTRSGDRNTYHLAGMVDHGRIRAQHGSGNYFEGALQNADTAAGTFYFKDGPSVPMQAKRTAKGRTAPGGLEWPAGFPPAN
ncbi:hypothetical protein [Fundidesulfovibrio agrisoli]|uniref:hypothetical protein n=1 Tax=Fundidesulfovibrio agrisoli TaxID=2922717 RepID=UPI001FAE2D87|nr:hypothetical protein [Fundidesulfovibrio agrisoli]